MRCDPFREGLSARLDGEDPVMDGGVLDAHLSTCPHCQAFAARSTALRRSVAVRPADAVPDLTGVILASAPAGRRLATEAESSHWTRWALMAVALTQLAIAIPPMLLGTDPGASVHIARELGAWDVALGAALLAVVIRPARAPGLLPFAGALALAMMLGAGADLLAGRTEVLNESQHLLDLAGLVLLWLTSRRPIDTTGLLDGMRRPRPALVH